MYKESIHILFSKDPIYDALPDSDVPEAELIQKNTKAISECEMGARALLNRIITQRKAKNVYLWSMTAGSQNCTREISIEDDTESVYTGIGVYLLGHHGGHVLGLSKMNAEQIAGRVRYVLNETSGPIGNLQKIVLLACRGAENVSKSKAKISPEKYNGHLFDGALLVQLCKEFNEPHILIAGYDNFVSICYQNHPIKDSVLQKKGNSGKRAVGHDSSKRGLIKLMSEVRRKKQINHKKVVKRDSSAPNGVSIVDLDRWSEKGIVRNSV